MSVFSPKNWKFTLNKFDYFFLDDIINPMKKIILAAFAVLLGSTGLFANPKDVVPVAVPGSFENAAPAKMKDILELDKKLSPKNDELVIYYYRKDGNYAPWALWIWANPGGDGGASWPFTQNWTVSDGIGYMRLKLDGSSTGGTKITSENGGLGLIVRQKDEWNKDGSDDRMWNINTSKKVAVFSGDQQTYAALDYKPSVKNAELLSLNQISVSLSGGFALDVDGGLSGFSVVTSDGSEYEIQSVVNADSPADLSQNMAKNILLTLKQNVSVSDSLVIKNPSFLADAKVNGTNLAVKLAETMVPAANEVLGCVYSNGSASFKLWAPTSSDVTLNIYKTSSQKSPDYRVYMEMNPKTGVWSGTFDRIEPDGLFYDYTIKNSKGTVTVLDPYASSMAVDYGKGDFVRAAIIDFNSPKAGKIDAPYVNLAKREDAVIYEISVRDFTSSPDANVKNIPGTYKAFIEKIPYLKELGITHVQLLPVLNFYSTNEMYKAYENSGTVNGNNYNWGYDPYNYFTPEGWYASDASDPYCRVRELRELINECHKAGIGVLLDVVYNHMAGTRFLDDIVPGYYFRTKPDGSYTSNSGCGNDTATEHFMMKKIVMDSTSHWVKNYKADGFRFDLMGLMEASSVTDSYALCAKINPSVLFEGEGWKMYNGPKGTFGMDQNYMMKTNSVSVFNDEFRDVFKAGGFNETGRGFITKKGASSEKILRNVLGNPVVNYHADQPGDNLNYLVCHDGLTLHDAIVNNLRLDENKDRKEIIQRIKMGNFFVLTSQGLAFLHGGQERGRTKPNISGAKNECVGNFVRNSYDSSDNINQFVWKIDSDYENLLEYTKGLIQLRKSFNIFRIGNAKKIQKVAKDLELEDNLTFGYTLKDGKSTWAVLVNAKNENIKINVGVSARSSVIYCDSDTVDVNGIQSASGVSVNGSEVELAPLTATVIRFN